MESWIVRGSVVCVLVTLASVILPRFLKAPEPGFAAATGAALLFFALAGAGFVGAIVLLVLTLKHYTSLGLAGRIAGLAPMAVVLAVIATMFVLVQRAARV